MKANKADDVVAETSELCSEVDLKFPRDGNI